MIDTSTTAGKIAVMQAFETGKTVEFFIERSESWEFLDSKLTPVWDWFKCSYRIKPQTVEEAAKHHVRTVEFLDYQGGFIAGAKWQKEQDNA